MNILSILDELASDTKRTFKEDILKREIDNELFKKVVVNALDPTLNFFIKKIPKYTPTGKSCLDWGIDGLYELSNRVVTGNAAIEWLQKILSDLSADDAQVIERIISKDLKCGVSTATVNKIWKNLIPEFTYMRCSLPKKVKLDEWDWENGIYSQEKADAMFANIDVYENGEVVITSRAGTVIPNDQLIGLVIEVSQSINKMTRLHGELMVWENYQPLPREASNGIMNSIASGGNLQNDSQYIKFFVWDQIPIVNAIEGTTYDVPYKTRFERLNEQLNAGNHHKAIEIIPTKIVTSYDEALEHYYSILAEGREGTIIKTTTGVWKNTTSKEQVKMKLEVTVDLRIIGFKEGNGKNSKTFGSIMCESSDGLLRVDVSGMKDDQREEISKREEEYLEKIMSVTSNKILPPSASNKFYSLFLPRMSEIREDKFHADSLQQIKDQFDSAINPVFV